MKYLDPVSTLIVFVVGPALSPATKVICPKHENAKSSLLMNRTPLVGFLPLSSLQIVSPVSVSHISNPV